MNTVNVKGRRTETGKGCQDAVGEGSNCQFCVNSEIADHSSH